MGKPKGMIVEEVALGAASGVTPASFYDACLQHRAQLCAEAKEMRALFDSIENTLDLIITKASDELYENSRLLLLAKWIRSETGRTHEDANRLSNSAFWLISETIFTVCGIVEPNKDEVRRVDGSRIFWTFFYCREDLEEELSRFISRFQRIESSIAYLIEDAGTDYKNCKTAYGWHAKKARSKIFKVRAKAEGFYSSADAYLRNLNAHYPHTIRTRYPNTIRI